MNEKMAVMLSCAVLKFVPIFLSNILTEILEIILGV